MPEEIQFGDAVIKPYVTFNGVEVAIHPTGHPQEAETPVEPLLSAEPEEELAPDPDPLVLNNVTLPRCESTRIRQMSPAGRKQWDADRFKCLTDQLFLSGVMGLDLQETPHRALFHQMLPKKPGAPLYSLDEVVKKRMILWSRGTAKTHAVRVELVQLILGYPNIRICFLTGSDDLAKNQLKALKLCFKSPTPRFKYLFPEFCLVSRQNKKGKWSDVDPDWGTKHEFTIPARTDHSAPEATFCISTARSVNSGSHFDVISIDDLVNDQTYRNAALLEAGYQSYLSICPLLDPRGYIIMTGTRYALEDTYERIIQNAEETGLNVWRFSIKNCWAYGCRNCKHPSTFHDSNINIVQGPCFHAGCDCKGFQSDDVRDVIFPEITKKNGDRFGFTLDFLDKTLKESGPKFFACQYLNDPVQDGSQVFTETLIGSVTLHDQSQLPSRMVSRTYLCGDLAYSTKSNERDESVIFAFQQYQGALYVWGCWFGRWTASQRVENILKLLREVRPHMTYFEENLNSDSLNLNLVSRAPEFSLAQLPLQWLPLSNRKNAKESRIGDIEAVMQGRRLFLCAPTLGVAYDRLTKQLLAFPHGKHDDFSDCLAQCVAAPTGFMMESRPLPESPYKWKDKYLGTFAEPQDNYYDSGLGTGLCG